MRKQFNLSNTIGDLLGDVSIKEGVFDVFIEYSDFIGELKIPRSQVSNVQMDQMIQEDDRLGCDIRDVAGEYEVDERGDIVSIKLTSNPYIVFSHYWGAEFFEDDKRYLIEMGIVNKDLNINDQSLGEYIKNFLKDLEAGEYE